MFQKSRMATAITIALASSAVLAMAPSQALAEDSMEEVVITGSRIARSGTETPTPMTTLDAESLKISADTSIAKSLLDLPQTGNIAGFNNNNSNFEPHSTGIATVDLRNLDPKRTLVLVNGRRHVGGNADDPSAVDINSIPSSFVERVEVITGGASAVYGSDAMAGVINIITKQDFEGLELRGQYGQTSESDGEGSQLDLTWGSKFGGERGHALFNLAYNDQKEITSADRGITDECLDGDGERDDQCFSILSAQTTVIPPAGPPITEGDGSWTKIFNGAEDGFDRAADRRLQVPLKTLSLAFNGKFQFNDKLGMFGEFSYLESEAKSTVEPIVMVPDFTLLFGDNPFIPQGVIDTYTDQGVPLPDPGAVVVALRRTTELGPRINEPERETGRLVLGLDGKINEDWGWEAYYQYGKNKQSQKWSGGLYSISRFNDGLSVEADPDNPGSYRCSDADARANGCVPIDIFGAGSISDGAVDYVGVVSTGEQEIEQHVLAATFTGQAFELPAGKVGIAAGLEYREDKLDTDYDQARKDGDVIASLGVPVNGEYDVTEGFLEVNVPVTEALFVDGAFRYSDYSTVGGLTSWKLGAQWQVADVRLRTTFSEANRAPNLFELNNPGEVGFPTFVDPCTDQGINGAGATQENCVAAGIPADWLPGPSGGSSIGVESGNPELKEETAETFSIGAVYQPGWWEGSSLTVDYWDIEIEDAVELIDAQVKLNGCYASTDFPETPFCSGIERADSSQNFVVNNLDTELQNIGKLETSGVDIAFAYLLDASSGLWNFSANGVYTKEFKRDILGTVDDNSEEPGYQEWKWNTRVAWSSGNWQLAWSTRYLGEGVVDNNLEGIIADNKLDSVWYHDLYASYNFELQSGAVEVYVGGDNVSDESAPYIPSNSANSTCCGAATNAGLYDIGGRYYYAGVRARF